MTFSRRSVTVLHCSSVEDFVLNPNIIRVRTRWLSRKHLDRALDLKRTPCVRLALQCKLGPNLKYRDTVTSVDALRHQIKPQSRLLLTKCDYQSKPRAVQHKCCQLFLVVVSAASRPCHGHLSGRRTLLPRCAVRAARYSHRISPHVLQQRKVIVYVCPLKPGLVGTFGISWRRQQHQQHSMCTRTGYLVRSPRTYCNINITRWTGSLGGRRPSKRPEPRTSPSFSQLVTVPATGVT